MAKRSAKKGTRKRAGPGKKPIESYDHKDKKRANNPPVGLALMNAPLHNEDVRAKWAMIYVDPQ